MSKARLVLSIMAGTCLLVLAIGLLLPKHWRVERQITIAADPSAIYPLIASFKNGWPAWSPFGEAQDPGIEMHFEGPESGAGAVQRWTQSKAGDGAMRMMRADPNGVDYELVMDNGFAMRGNLRLIRDGGATRVVWSDEGELGNNPLRRYVGIMLEGVVGRSFEQGLAALKKRAEAGPGPASH